MKLPKLKLGGLAAPLQISLQQQFWLLAGVALALLMATSGGFYLVSIRSQDEASSEALRLVAETAANDLGRSLALIADLVERQAQDPGYGRILGGGDAQRILDAETRLTQGIPNALLARLVPEPAEALDEQRVPHMGFADLEAVREAQAAAPQPAMHAANTPDAHIALARRLAEGKGTILASLAPQLVTKALPRPGHGALELKQQELVLAFQGDATLRPSEPDGAVTVPGTAWTLSYWGQPVSGPEKLWLLSFTGVAALLIAAGGYFMGRWATYGLRHDQDNVVLLVRDLLTGKGARKYPIRLKEMRKLMLQLEQLKMLATEAPPKSKPKPANFIKPAEADVAPVATGIQVVEEEEPAPPALPVSVDPGLFRAFDICGVAGQNLSAGAVELIGRAIGSEARERGEHTVAIARDGRLSSAELSAALGRGLLSSGCSVIDLGLVPIPVLYFATHVLNSESGVMVTASHEPAEMNGLKIVLAGEVLALDDVQKLKARIERQQFSSGPARIETRNIIPDYLDRIVHDTQIGRPMKVVVDCGNGATGSLAPVLLEEIGCEALPLFTTVDGNFPNHLPDPSLPENLATLIRAVQQEKADLGIAFDGDGDRLGVVDSSGKIIWPDRQMMLLAADVLSREPGSDVIFDVQCTRHLASQIVKNGGRPMMWKSGHPLIHAKLKESGALLAGEMSGHIFFKERWYGFDDGLYACARLLEILSSDPRDTVEVFAELPDGVRTPRLSVAMAPGENRRFVEQLRAIADFPDARVSDIDGLRIDFADGWGLARASSSSDALVLRFEADNPDALSRVQSEFKALMLKVNPRISFPLSIS
jgi:phosphomannomutase/phosphoglucomutase